MMNFLKQLRVGQFPLGYRIIIVFILLLVMLLPLLLKIFEKSPEPTTNNSNTGVELNNVISKKGTDSRSAMTTIVGDNNSVTNNSDGIANK